MMTFNIVTDLYVAGITEDGQEYTADAYSVVGEDEEGNRVAWPESFRSCRMSWANDPEYGPHQIIEDLRDQALAAAEKVRDALQSGRREDVVTGPKRDMALVRIHPSYGSPAHAKVGDAGIGIMDL